MIAKFRKSKKGQKQSILFSILLGILTIGVIGFLVFSNLKISQKRAKLTSQLEALRNQIQVLEQRKRELQAKISYQKSEEYLEEIARDRLNLKSPGEKVIAFTKEGEEEKGEMEKEKNFLEKILEKLKFW